MNEKDSFAKIFTREGVLPVKKRGALPERLSSGALLPPDSDEDGEYAEKRGDISGGADRRRLAALPKKPPEDSLDLHGLTAAEAHAALDNFLRAQIAAGRRHVEIIHGKGAPGGGVLRAKTRKWLSNCPAAVLGWTEPPNNGGAVRAMLRRLR